MALAPPTSKGALNLALSERDVDLIETLALKVRVLTVNQIARTWWCRAAQPTAAARHRLAELERAGFVVSFTAIAHPEIPLSCPVISWTPGLPAPNFGAASHRLKTRWSQPPTETRCVFVSPVTGRHFGGSGGRRPRESEETHDIHLAQVYLLLRLRDPEAAQNWVSEESVRAGRDRRDEKLPDAIVDTPGERRVVEFGGAYAKAKLEAFHRYCCQELQLPYEVW
jgi:hypothetical protein